MNFFSSETKDFLAPGPIDPNLVTVAPTDMFQKQRKASLAEWGTKGVEVAGHIAWDVGGQGRSELEGLLRGRAGSGYLVGSMLVVTF